MKFKILILTIFFLAFFGGAESSLAATYYIDGSSGNDTNPGTIESPWQTLYKANQTLVAGDTVYLRGGTSSFQAYAVTTNSGSGEGIRPAHSGAPGNPITYSVYPGEKVELVGNGTAGLAGVYIVGHDHIKVTGYDGSTAAMNLKVRNVAFPFWIGDGRTWWDETAVGSSYCEISYAEFGPNDAASAFWGERPGAKLFYHSTYNWIHHCSIHGFGGYDASDSGYDLEIGRDTCGVSTNTTYACEDTTGYNVIENNHMYHGGHHVLGINMNHNIVRNNSFHNEQWYLHDDGNYYGYRVIYFSGEHNYPGTYAHYQNVFEGNTVSHSAMNYRNDGSLKALVQLSTGQNIIRNNNYYAGDGWAFYIEAHTGHSNIMYARENHIYNNTFFSNGYGSGRPPGSSGSVTTADPADRAPIFFVSGYSANPVAFSSSYNTPTYDYEYGNWDWHGDGVGTLYGTVIKNNLFWKSYSGATNYQGGYHEIVSMMKDNASPWGSLHASCADYYCGNTVIDSNWTTNSNSNTGYGTNAFVGYGDPKFVSEGSYGSPSINTLSDWEYYWVLSGNPTPPVDITSVPGLTQPDLRLTASSPVINQGASLTTAVGSASNSVTLVVADAKYFQPGWGNGAGGGAVVAADTIALGSVSNTVQIEYIDYATNTLTLNSARSWNNGDEIWLKQNSSGGVVLAGEAPDIGANEYVSGGDTMPPSAPSGLSVI